MLSILSIYLVGINVMSFLLFALDKRKAKHNRWRISEAALLWSAFLGGSFGAFLSMSAFHHKTLHKRFTILVPLFLMLHILLLLGVLYYC